MEFVLHYMVLIAILGALTAYQCLAQLPYSSASSARALDSLLQGYAYRAFVHPRTGIPYNGSIPSNFTGISIAALRLRFGSLRKRGVERYEEFRIPNRVTVNPYVERLVLVYQNLGNWSSFYYPLPDYSYLTPVLGLLAYDAANLSAANLLELDLVVSGPPISINFANVIPVPSGFVAKCVWFGLDGTQEFRDLASTNVCSTYRQGHYSIVVNSTALAPPPAPSEGPGVRPSLDRAKHNKSKAWKIVGGVVGGIVGLVLVSFLAFWIHRHVQKKKVAKMEQQSEVAVALQMLPIGNTKAPVATGTRTQPNLENEYVA